MLRLLALLVVLASAGAHAQPACPVPGLPTSPEVAFEPDQGAEALILKVIDASVSSVRVSAFAFSSPAIVNALVKAKGRGVDVRVVVDQRHNIEEDPKQIGRKALGALVRAGIATRTTAKYRLHHDKFIVVDACHVETGSYNYAVSANKNSENVLVLWNSPDLAAKYLSHWESRFAQATAYH